MSANTESPEHLLVTGLPRTGSSVVADALARHRDIAMLNEARQETAALIVGKRYAGNRLYMPAQLDYKPAEQATGILSVRRRTSSHKRGYLHSYMQQRAKIIVTYRDAGSSIESLIRAMGIPADEAIRIWSRAMELTTKLVKHYRTRLYVCEYESLKLEPASELGRILSFLNLPDDDVSQQFVEDQFRDAGPRSHVDETSGDALRLSDLAPLAFAMYNGICSFRLNRDAASEDYPKDEGSDSDSNNYPAGED